MCIDDEIKGIEHCLIEMPPPRLIPTPPFQPMLHPYPTEPVPLIGFPRAFFRTAYDAHLGVTNVLQEE